MDKAEPKIKELLEKTKKHVVIFDSCQFTMRGLTLLCERHAGWRMCGTADSFSQLWQLLARQRVDLVLCGIGKRADDFSRLLNLPDYFAGRCILLTDKSSAVLRAAFLSAGFDAVTSKQVSLTALDSLLYYTMYSSSEEGRAERVATCYRPLEREVLSALLLGKKPHAIARDMGVSYRTVSRYKQNGLKRAGLNSLNEILACQKNYVAK
ncbi:response regulator transcription factor [Serratia rubidaea]|uniref:Response regulator transcription factor n=1 Tax=Serratia rubidaea TaxID=61652 RepID=A0ABS0MDK3_SERRU|nr:LuxR C-terminal-related transcriptional regulator [Serratia rubidaea]MBH1930372.1 response regulator transcription factor [Serratia rubidaea]